MIFTIPENTNGDKTKRQMHPQRRGWVRWSAPSRDFNETFYKRLNQPMDRDIRCHRLKICPEWDWYVPESSAAWDERLRRKHVRNLVIKEQLRVCSLSMYPLVHKGDCCLFEPVVYVSKLRIGDIIFCQLDIGG